MLSLLSTQRLLPWHEQGPDLVVPLCLPLDRDKVNLRQAAGSCTVDCASDLVDANHGTQDPAVRLGP